MRLRVIHGTCFGREVRTDQDVFIPPAGHLAHIFRGQLAELRRETAFDFNIRIPKQFRGQSDGFIFSLYRVAALLQERDGTGEYERITQSTEPSVEPGNPGRKLGCLIPALLKLTAEPGGFRVAAGKVQFGDGALFQRVKLTLGIFQAFSAELFLCLGQADGLFHNAMLFQTGAEVLR